MKNLMRYARQVNQRRMTAFYLLPQPGDNDMQSSKDQLRIEHIVSHEDRPRSLREMFADVEYDNDDEGA